MASESDGKFKKSSDEYIDICESIRNFIQINENDSAPVINLVDNVEAGPSNEFDTNNRISDDELNDLVEEQLVLNKIKEMQNVRLNLNRENHQGTSLQSGTTDCETDEEDDDSFLNFETVEERNTEENQEEEAEKISKALTLNVVMQSELSKLELHLLRKLNDNIEMQLNVKNEIILKANSINKFNTDTLKGWYAKFGIPYFKDERKFPASGNMDHMKMVYNGQMLTINFNRSRLWRLSEKNCLEKGVRRCIVNKECAKFLVRRDVLKEELLNNVTQEREIQIKSEITDMISKIDSFENKTLANLFSECSPDEEFDWHYISIDFVDSHSPQECQRMWHLYVKPSINKKKWTAIEDLQLSELVTKHNNENWDVIAKELRTNRTGYQCFVNYQTRLNKTIRKIGKWTMEEDKELCSLISKCRVGNYIPWPKVAYYFHGRSLPQIYSRWNSSLNPDLKKGRFSKYEDRLIVAFVRKYGEDFRRISKMIGDRTSAQLRERYIRTYPHRTRNFGRWSLEEDQLLFSLIKEHGISSWSVLSKHFITRTRTQIRQRYKAINRILEKKPNLKIQDLERGPMALAQSVLTSDVVSTPVIEQKSSKSLSELIQEDKVKNDLFKKENAVLLRKISMGRKKMIKRNDVDLKLINYFKESYTNEKLRLKTNYVKPDIEKAAEAMLLFCKFLKSHIPLTDKESDKAKCLPLTLRKVFHRMISLENKNWGCDCIETFSLYRNNYSLNSSIDCLPMNQEDTIVSGEDFLLHDFTNFNKREDKRKSREKKVSHFIPYYLPPNIITGICFRSILLIKDKIKTSITHNNRRYEFFLSNDVHTQNNSGIKRFTGYFSEESSEENENIDHFELTIPSERLTIDKYTAPLNSECFEKPSTSKKYLSIVPSNSRYIFNSKRVYHSKDNSQNFSLYSDEREECSSKSAEEGKRLTEQEAINLWKERLMAILGWPIVLSNHYPEFSENSSVTNKKSNDQDKPLPSKPNLETDAKENRTARKRKSDNNCPIKQKIQIKEVDKKIT